MPYGLLRATRPLSALRRPRPTPVNAELMLQEPILDSKLQMWNGNKKTRNSL
jgi:hypothetical protein